MTSRGLVVPHGDVATRARVISYYPTEGAQRSALAVTCPHGSDLAQQIFRTRYTPAFVFLASQRRVTHPLASRPNSEGNGEGGVASDSSKKKVALLISYWGSNYQGLQM